MNTPHYLRFARALALAAFVPGCVDADTSASDPSDASYETADSAPVDDPPVAVDDGDATVRSRTALQAASLVDTAEPGTGGGGGEGGGRPFSSGPIVPPELPRGFA